VDAVFALMAAERARLTRTVYNIMAYAPSADEFRTLTRRYFPAAEISYIADTKRQAIVDSWPAAVNDSAARRDWSFAPRFDLEATFAAYLMPAIKRRYSI
jgi:nucleoside-diphosphate-sugar epimerase